MEVIKREDTIQRSARISDISFDAGIVHSDLLKETVG
jgi:hypothetical protein